MKHKIAFAMIMGVVTTGIISFTLISVNIGFGTHFFGVWLQSWGMAYCVAIPTILVFSTRVQKLVDSLFREAQTKKKLIEQ